MALKPHANLRIANRNIICKEILTYSNHMTKLYAKAGYIKADSEQLRDLKERLEIQMINWLCQLEEIDGTNTK